MKYFFVLTIIALVALLPAGPAGAGGCIKGAIVGGVVGHYAGHHGKLGVVAGCVAGHHEAKKHEQTEGDATPDHTLMDYYDKVVVEGLVLVEIDARRGLRDGSQVQQINDTIRELMEDLSHFEDKTPDLTEGKDQQEGRQLAPESDLPVVESAIWHRGGPANGLSFAHPAEVPSIRQSPEYWFNCSVSTDSMLILKLNPASPCQVWLD